MSRQDEMQWFSLRPADAWFFRDGRPSNRGEDQSDLQSLFPPHPFTVIGAIRAAAARAMGWQGKGNWSDSIRLLLGDGFEDLGQLRFEGPFLAHDEELLFPLPAHVVGRTKPADPTSDDPSKRFKQFQPEDWLVPSVDPICCDLGDAVQLPVLQTPVDPDSDEKPPAHSDEFYVTQAGMQRILDGQLPEKDQCIHRDALYAFEARVGIQRDEKTRTTGEDAIYSPHYVRLMENVSLRIGVAAPPEFSLPAAFPLGGEARMALCEPIDSPTLALLRDTSNGADILCLMTPAFFPERDWYGGGPGDDAKRLTPSDDESNVSLAGAIQTCCLDRPLWIGGFGVHKKDHKRVIGPLPLTPHAPASTVWWLDTPVSSEDGTIRLGKRNAHGHGLALVARRPAPASTNT